MNKQTFFSLVLLFVAQTLFAQIPEQYFVHVKEADSLYKIKQYQAAANAYSKAFEANNWKGRPDDRYNAACTWAMAGNKDSAFFQLFRIALKSKYQNYEWIMKDTDLLSLYEDKRWKEVTDIILQNKTEAEKNLNKPLKAVLENIQETDQKYRKMATGINTPEQQELWQIINMQDSINTVIVCSIIDKYGWLGPDVVGGLGNGTLFLVIQHADIKVQEKYLPLMREAVKNKKASPADLALLEDRVALRNGKKQIYGSQVDCSKPEKCEVLPIEDEANVNIRRAEVGLEPLEVYLQYWNIKYELPKK